MNWDQYFMTLCYIVATKSKDQRTNIGAVIVGPDNEIRSTGYNSFVRGINDEVPERQEKPEKYFWFEHSERNSIYNAARMGLSTKGCKMYTQGIPCADCARAVIQAGLSEVIVHTPWNDLNSEKWQESGKRSLTMFEEAGVKVRYYDGPVIGQINLMRNGIELTISKDGKVINVNEE